MPIFPLLRPLCDLGTQKKQSAAGLRCPNEGKSPDTDLANSLALP